MSQNKEIYRHEWKYLINDPEKEILLQKLSHFMRTDEHAGGQGYFVRSLYFDDRDATSYEEKMAGISERRKYRIRIYNYSDQTIRLECKKKDGQYINKTGASLSRDEFDRILRGDYEFLKARKEKVCLDFYGECTLKGMRPAVIVDYDRIPLVYPYGDVRITFDSHVRAAFTETDIFSDRLPVFEVLEPHQLVMEVKYTEFLPKMIQDLIQVKDSIYTSASKYAMCFEKKQEHRNV